LFTNIWEASVTPTESGSVQFDGKVDVNLGDWGEAIISFRAYVDQGWAALVAPDTMAFTSDGEQNFNVTVIVPAASPANPSGQLKVEGSLRAGAEVTVATAQAIVIVKPYYRVSVESNEQQTDLALGEYAMLTVKVWNNGNSPDSFNLTLENLDGLRRAGWDVGLDRTMLARVQYNAYSTMRIKIGAPPDWSIYEDKTAVIRLVVSSINAADRGDNVAATYTLSVRVRGFNMPAVEASLAVTAAIIAAVGAVVFKRRGRPKPKTVKDYQKELDLDKGD
jgi:uncharacterized membrane protein